MYCVCCYATVISVAIVVAVFAICRWRWGGKSKASGSGLRVAFLHPDLGIGGAERLVIDAAVALQNNGHQVVMYTAHHNPDHCFIETKDGTLVVRVAGDWLPRHILRKGHVLFATLRMWYLTISFLLFSDRVDVVIIDQVSLPLLLIRILAPQLPSLFYCHFPDKLCDATLSTRRSVIRKLYRLIFDSLEEFCFKSASRVVFNSAFTKETTITTFPSLCSTVSKDKTDILYPPLNCSNLAKEPENSGNRLSDDGLENRVLVVSINRFEEKKNISLAIDAFNAAVKDISDGKTSLPNGKVASDLRLVLAGGYDPRLSNNVEYFQKLEAAAKESPFSSQIRFLTSFTEYEKYFMLRHADVLLYTPTAEHFGIVPLEAMYCGVPVVAVNAAGPLETVVDGKTGFLRPPTAIDFAAGIKSVLTHTNKAKMSTEATAHVNNNFTLEAFAFNLQRNLRSIVSGE
eukprot:TRINITY_DN4504_c2_g2_i1.p1 TRINITY_DN4504_c2_g2~~TRINITY_DN4504_c2_g2_i1.p1  ORF type:complete len:458 (+),score=69.51 TRINITY_DN4504_c2_g2_i1:91-1464(+)